MVNGYHTQTADVFTLSKQYLGVEPQLVTDFDRLLVRMDERVQSRIDQNNAPLFQVNRYANQMSESKFPPPLLTSNYIPVDGNTRLKARGKRNERYIEALVLPIPGDTADQDTWHKLLLLSLALNAMNGLPLDETERLKYAAELMKNSASDEEIVGMTGLPITKVTALRDQQRATERLTRLGIDTQNLNVGNDILRAFGKLAVTRLDDESFKGIVDLTKAAGLTNRNIGGLVASLNEAPSAESRRDRLARERQALEPQILANLQGHKQPMYTAKLQKALELLLSNPVTAFIEGNMENSLEYARLIEKSIEKLTELHTLQLAKIPPAPQTHQEIETVQ